MTAQPTMQKKDSGFGPFDFTKAGQFSNNQASQFSNNQVGQFSNNQAFPQPNQHMTNQMVNKPLNLSFGTENNSSVAFVSNPDQNFNMGRSRDSSSHMLNEKYMSSSSESIDSSRCLEKLLFRIFLVSSKEDGNFFIFKINRLRDENGRSSK